MDSRQRILIVDDDESSSKSLSFILGNKGFHTDTAITGTEALDKVQKKYFNLALLDIRLPDMDGVELIEPFKKIHPDMETLILTGYASMETAVRALNLGASSYLTKPLNLDELLLKIDQVLEKQRLVIENRKLFQEVRKTSEKFQQLFDEAPVGYHEIDTKGRIVRVNSTELQMLGYSQEEMIGKPIWDFVVEKEAHEAVLNKLSGTVTIGEGFERTYICKNGTVIPVLIEDKLLKDDQGNITGIQSTIQDITKIKQVEEALRTSEEKYRLLIENANEAIFVAQDGMLKFMNPKTIEIIGFTEKELGSKPFVEFIHQEDREIVSERHRKRLAGDELPQVYDFRIIDKEGSIIWCEINVVLIEWEGRPATLNFLTDITKRKLAEEEKAKLQDQLLQSQKMEAIGTLAGGVAHDFNNILTTIQGFATISIMKLDRFDPLRGNLIQIKQSAKRAADLTRQLLAFSRKQPLEFVPLNINNCVEHLLKILNRLIGEDISITTELQSDVWTVQADTGNLEQVIINLAVNARDAMTAGGRISIKTENVTFDEYSYNVIPDARPGRYVCISIQDTGNGMENETIEHIFEPFFTTKDVDKGTGLGLSVVYGIIKQHEGYINVYSEVGHGSVFKVYLPATSVIPEDGIRETLTVQESQTKGERILLVEDDKYVRNFTADVLSEIGYKVIEASNVQEALHIFERDNGNFRLVFTDVVLPDKTGLDLVNHIRSREPNMPVLLCSGYTDKKSQWQVIKDKGYKYLQKPFDVQLLLKTIKEVMQE